MRDLLGGRRVTSSQGSAAPRNGDSFVGGGRGGARGQLNGAGIPPNAVMDDPDAERALGRVATTLEICIAKSQPPLTISHDVK
jgi:hypothetical protein